MLKDFLSSQVFSVIVGSFLTLVISVIMSRKNVTNTMEQEISKERIETYKKMYSLVCKLNHNLSYATDIKIPTDCFIGYIRAGKKEYHKGYCFPTVFFSFKSFDNYKSTFSTLLNDNRLFLEQTTTNKLNFLDSYLGNIWHLTYDKDDSYLHLVGYALSNEISELVQDIEDEILHFINSDNKKHIKNSFTNAYHYEYEKMNNTELSGWFLKNNIEKFGDFPLCENCNCCKKCPLNTILEQEKQ